METKKIEKYLAEFNIRLISIEKKHETLEEGVEDDDEDDEEDEEEVEGVEEVTETLESMQLHSLLNLIGLKVFETILDSNWKLVQDDQ